jgi:hypothetical protein
MGSTLYHGQTKFPFYTKTRTQLNLIPKRTNEVTSKVVCGGGGGGGVNEDDDVI